MIEDLSDELSQRWQSHFAQKNWEERLDLLRQIQDQLKEDLEDLESFVALLPLLVRKLIDGLPPAPIGSFAQAHIYANSDAEEHRQLAGQWLRAQSAALT
ncbi:MAG TPA: hypothetical protein VJR47_03035 [Stellaceae bacterium]|nr:hypothetical protein [Stellaceae bacterium]